MTESQGEFTSQQPAANLTAAQDTVDNRTATKSVPQTHPLQSNWQFWYYQRQSPQQYFAANSEPKEAAEKQAEQPKEVEQTTIAEQPKSAELSKEENSQIDADKVETRPWKGK